MRWMLILCLVAACGPRGWDRTNTAMEATMFAELAVDGYQTRTIVSNCQEYNPVIGPCGDRVPLGVYIPVTAVLHAVIAYALPPRARNIFQAATAGAEAHVIYFNSIVPDQPATRK